jgi:transketolase
VLCLSRQALPVLDRAFAAENPVARGAYVVSEPQGPRDVTLIATGSEVAIAVAAADLLRQRSVRAAVVSIPCFELFAAQPHDYRSAILGGAPRVGVEAAVEGSWRRWLGETGEFVGMTGFGASAPASELYLQFGITAEAVTVAAERAVARARPESIAVPA